MIGRIAAFVLICVETVGVARAQPVPEGIHREESGEISICDLSGPTVEAIRSQLLAMPGVSELATAEGPYTAYYQEQPQGRVWTFTTSDNAAHPAIICRTIEEADGQTQIRMDITCGASRELCDGLYRQFEALNRRTLGTQQ